MERIALISDIHGNAIALRAVLDAIANEGITRIACLGDVFTMGPHPNEVLALLEGRCECFILGNHDEYLFDTQSLSGHTQAPEVISAVDWCRQTLGLPSLPFVQHVRLALGHTDVLLFHGSPSSNNVDLVAQTPDAALDAQLGSAQATVMAGGHTHIQMLRQHRGRLLVNPGSVGMPFERFVSGGPPKVLPLAELAIIEATEREVRISLRRIKIDRDALIAAARAWDQPMGRYLASNLET